MSRHFIFTNREITKNPGIESNYLKVNDEEYLRKDGKELALESIRVGTIEIKGNKPKITILKEEFDLSEQHSFLGQSKRNHFPSNTCFRELYESMKSKKPYQGEVLVYIHGYNCDVDCCLELVMKLHKKYVDDDDCPIEHLVLFSWPAMDKVFEYRDDARDAKQSGYAFARSLRKLGEFLNKELRNEDNCDQRIHLMAHSMGVRVLESMMSELSDEEEFQLTDLFSEVLLVATDVDSDALERPRPMYDLIDICQRIHVLYHKKDVALGISENTKNAFNRLGKHGPKSSTLLADNVYAYDVTHTRDDRDQTLIRQLGNHWYHYSSSDAVELIIDILNDYQEDLD